MLEKLKKWTKMEIILKYILPCENKHLEKVKA